ncbi:MAG: leucine--tRNA ligase [Alphaproteobacteria bacterium]|nr:leucine--tRNA ligase [Alphaproteobacteria bacterium]
MIYPFKEIEKKWRVAWEENGTFLTQEDKAKPKYYILDMFPYPSGQGLHVGHLKGYVASDVVARYKRMQGFNVLHPMGWDAFGLPAERQASRENIHPADLVARNVAVFKEQLSRVGLSYDWEREISTTDPSYYKWTQWLFKQLYEKGLAYQADVPVNWCPALGTVLANEEVKDGVYIETGDAVEQRVMKQWMLKITAYSDRLVDDLQSLDWPDSVKEMQRQWIGRSEGALVSFQIENTTSAFDVFTTRSDTLFGGTYCVLAPEHPLIAEITSPEARDRIRQYVEETQKKSERDRLASAGQKTGVFTGAMAINPANGKAIPIWISDYVLMTYGTGAVFGCPAHDERDHAFARQHNLPIVPVVSGGDVQKAAWMGDGLHINSGFLDGLNTEEAKQKITKWLVDNDRGSPHTTYRLRDWLFSRQRYWGEPFPFLYDENGNINPVPDENLPVQLPMLTNWESVRGEITPLASCRDWAETTNPHTGRLAVRETNTMPQWAGSSWYFLRFCDPHNADRPWSQEKERHWMPVDLYIGGVEHATLHLLYARFWHKVFYDLGLVSTSEPFKKLVNQGLITARSFRDSQGRYHYPEDAEETENGWVTKEGKLPLDTKVEKMSKSRYNVVRPDDVIDRYGADTLRIFEAFIGPVDKGGVWQDEHIVGPHRFLERVYQLASRKNFAEKTDSKLEQIMHRTIKQVTQNIEEMNLNTAISRLMEASNELCKRQHTKEDVSVFVRMIAPFAPHIAEECWENLGNKGSVAYASWPAYDPDLTKEDRMQLPIQINGKLRATLDVEHGMDKDEIMALINENPNTAKLLERQNVKKVIHIPNKIINFVVG